MISIVIYQLFAIIIFKVSLEIISKLFIWPAHKLQLMTINFLFPFLFSD